MEAKNAVFDHAVFKLTKDLPPLEITRDAKEKDSITPTHNIPAGGHFVIFIWKWQNVPLLVIKLERFWVADDQTRAILDCRRSNSRDFGLQRVKLKRFWIAEGQTQAILGCRGSTSNDFGLQRVKLTRFEVAEGQTQAILGCRGSNSSDFGLQRVKLKRFWIAEGQTQAISELGNKVLARNDIRNPTYKLFRELSPRVWQSL